MIIDQAEKYDKDLDNWNNTITMIEDTYRNHYIQGIEIWMIFNHVKHAILGWVRLLGKSQKSLKTMANIRICSLMKKH